MNAVVSQPRYLPALNYIQRLFHAQTFVVLDNVQRQARGWENRNKIMTDSGESWVTIPIASSSRAMVEDTIILESAWVTEHKKKIATAYEKAPYYDQDLIESYYADVDSFFSGENASFRDVIVFLLNNCCSIFGFSPNIVLASQLAMEQEAFGAGKIVEICKCIGVEAYVSGPNGVSYGIIEAFAGSGINVLFHEFSHPVYPQFNNKGFAPYMSFFDAIFNLGVDEVSKIIKADFVLLNNIKEVVHE